MGCLKILETLETFEKCSISFKLKTRESRFSGINHRNILDISRIKI